MYDAIIIGTGQAGVPLAFALAEAGQSVAVIEKNHFGGTCVNDGCTPTKAYVASARWAHITRNAERHGIRLSEAPQIDLKAIKARKDKLVQESRSGIEKSLKEHEKIKVFKGVARFADAHTVEVEGQKIQGRKIFINVGGRARVPKGYEGVPLLNNTSILELEEIPPHLLVVGGGYVGLEFAQMFHRFGSKVTLVEMKDRLLSRESSATSKAIADMLREEGVQVRLQAECLSGEKLENGHILLHLDCEDDEREVEGTHLLMAIGRVPNTDDLNLEAAGVEVNERGYISVNDQLQTSASHIYALGDCNGEGAFTHTAYNDFQIVQSQLLGDGQRKLSNRIVAYSSYIDPPLAHIGLQAEQIREKGISAKRAYREMSRVARAKEMGETTGFMEIFIDAKSNRILGATLFGVGADEIIHAILDLMYADAPYTVMRDAVHIHPTVSELLPTMLENLEPLD